MNSIFNLGKMCHVRKPSLFLQRGVKLLCFISKVVSVRNLLRELNDDWYFAMILLIDAYNLIRFLNPGPRQPHDAQVVWVLSRLSTYFKSKRSELEEIIVVFDGGLFSHKTREIVGGIVTVYAGGGRKADDVLVHYARDFRERALLVTNDRELQRRALASKTSALEVGPFWRLVDAVVERKEQSDATVHLYAEVTITKTVSDISDGIDETLDSAELDSLMIAGSLRDSFVSAKTDQSPSRRTPGCALSKKNKRVELVRKKLG